MAKQWPDPDAAPSPCTHTKGPATPHGEGSKAVAQWTRQPLGSSTGTAQGAFGSGGGPDTSKGRRGEGGEGTGRGNSKQAPAHVCVSGRQQRSAVQ